MAKLREEEFSRLLDTVAGKRVFDEVFIEKLRGRAGEVERTMWRLSTFNLVLVAVLFINAFVLPTGVNISGLSAQDVGKIKEVVLFVSATLTLFVSTMWIDLLLMRDLGKAWMRHNYGDGVASYTQELFGAIAFELPAWSAQARKNHFTTLAHKILGIVLGLLMLVCLVALLAAVLGVYVTIVFDVIEKPSLPFAVSWFVIIYAGAAYLSHILLQFLWTFPMPYRDYSLVAELSELQKRDPEAYKERMAGIAARR